MSVAGCRGGARDDRKVHTLTRKGCKRAAQSAHGNAQRMHTIYNRLLTLRH